MPTETVDPRFVEIDRWPTALALEAMHEGQLAALAAVQATLPAIAIAADAAAERLRGGGRLAYAGAGTSGRIAVQDGVELTPTYNWPPERLVFLLAGGSGALIEAVEGAEDNREAGRGLVADKGLGPDDILIGVAASGRTPFTVAAIKAARAAGALTIGLSNNADTPLLAAAEHALLADTGSELVAGSTRMKAGTAQKAVLNMLSTAIMLRCGLVYRGLMVNMRASNEKLRLRAHRMVADLAHVSEEAAGIALDAAQGEIKAAVLIAHGIAPAEAEALLVRHHGILRTAMESIGR